MVENARDAVSRHDVGHEVPPRTGEDGFPVGNGHVGGMVRQPEVPSRIVVVRPVM